MPVKGQRSPIRLVKNAQISAFLRRPIYQWTCDENATVAAEFVHRKDPRRLAVLHRSTKPGPTWQLSFFDKDGAVRDLRAPTCALALRELIPQSEYRLRDVVRR